MSKVLNLKYIFSFVILLALLIFPGCNWCSGIDPSEMKLSENYLIDYGNLLKKEGISPGTQSYAFTKKFYYKPQNAYSENSAQLGTLLNGFSSLDDEAVVNSVHQVLVSIFQSPGLEANALNGEDLDKALPLALALRNRVFLSSTGADNDLKNFLGDSGCDHLISAQKIACQELQKQTKSFLQGFYAKAVLLALGSLSKPFSEKIREVENNLNTLKEKLANNEIKVDSGNIDLGVRLDNQIQLCLEKAGKAQANIQVIADIFKIANEKIDKSILALQSCINDLSTLITGNNADGNPNVTENLLEAQNLLDPAQKISDEWNSIKGDVKSAEKTLKNQGGAAPGPEAFQALITAINAGMLVPESRGLSMAQETEARKIAFDVSGAPKVFYIDAKQKMSEAEEFVKAVAALLLDSSSTMPTAKISNVFGFNVDALEATAKDLDFDNEQKEKFLVGQATQASKVKSDNGRNTNIFIFYQGQFSPSIMAKMVSAVTGASSAKVIVMANNTAKGNLLGSIAAKEITLRGLSAQETEMVAYKEADKWNSSASASQKIDPALVSQSLAKIVKAGLVKNVSLKAAEEAVKEVYISLRERRPNAQEVVKMVAESAENHLGANASSVLASGVLMDSSEAVERNTDADPAYYALKSGQGSGAAGRSGQQSIAALKVEEVKIEQIKKQTEELRKINEKKIKKNEIKNFFTEFKTLINTKKQEETSNSLNRVNAIKSFAENIANFAKSMLTSPLCQFAVNNDDGSHEDFTNRVLLQPYNQHVKDIWAQEAGIFTVNSDGQIAYDSDALSADLKAAISLNCFLPVSSNPGESSQEKVKNIIEKSKNSALKLVNMLDGLVKETLDASNLEKAAGALEKLKNDDAVMGQFLADIEPISQEIKSLPGYPKNDTDALAEQAKDFGNFAAKDAIDKLSTWQHFLASSEGYREDVLWRSYIQGNLNDNKFLIFAARSDEQFMRSNFSNSLAFGMVYEAEKQGINRAETEIGRNYFVENNELDIGFLFRDEKNEEDPTLFSLAQANDIPDVNIWENLNKRLWYQMASVLTSNYDENYLGKTELYERLQEKKADGAVVSDAVTVSAKVWDFISNTDNLRNIISLNYALEIAKGYQNILDLAYGGVGDPKLIDDEMLSGKPAFTFLDKIKNILEHANVDDVDAGIAYVVTNELEGMLENPQSLEFDSHKVFKSSAVSLRAEIIKVSQIVQKLKGLYLK